MQRIYKRVKGIFKSIGWICIECRKVELDAEPESVEKKKPRNVRKK